MRPAASPSGLQLAGMPVAAARAAPDHRFTGAQQWPTAKSASCALAPGGGGGGPLGGLLGGEEAVLRDPARERAAAQAGIPYTLVRTGPLRSIPAGAGDPRVTEVRALRGRRVGPRHGEHRAVPCLVCLRSAHQLLHGPRTYSQCRAFEKFCTECVRRCNKWGAFARSAGPCWHHRIGPSKF